MIGEFGEERAYCSRRVRDFTHHYVAMITGKGYVDGQAAAAISSPPPYVGRRSQSTFPGQSLLSVHSDNSKLRDRCAQLYLHMVKLKCT